LSETLLGMSETDCTDRQYVMMTNNLAPFTSAHHMVESVFKLYS